MVNRSPSQVVPEGYPPDKWTRVQQQQQQEHEDVEWFKDFTISKVSDMNTLVDSL